MELSTISRSLWIDIGVIAVVAFGSYFITDFFQPRFQELLQTRQKVQQNVALYQELSQYDSPDLVSSRIGYLPTEWSSSDIQRVVSRVLQEEGVTFDGIQLGKGKEEPSMQASERFAPVYRKGTVTIDFQSSKTEMQNVIERFENAKELEWFMKVVRLDYGDSENANQIQGSIELEIYYQ